MAAGDRLAISLGIFLSGGTGESQIVSWILIFL